MMTPEAGLGVGIILASLGWWFIWAETHRELRKERRRSTSLLASNVALGAELLDVEGQLDDARIFATVQPELDAMFGDTSPLAQLEWEQHNADAHRRIERPSLHVVPAPRVPGDAS